MNPLNPFAEPARVVAVALNPALDQTIEVAGLRPGAVNRALRMQVDVGGKAVNVASCLSDFGVNAAVDRSDGPRQRRAVRGLVPAQENRQPLLLSRWPDPDQHQAGRYRQRRDHRPQHAGAGVRPGRRGRLLEQVLQRLDRLVERTRVMGGAIRQPAAGAAGGHLRHHYRAGASRWRVGAAGHQRRRRCEAALAAGPKIVKPNRHELAELLGRPLDSLEALVAAGRELLAGSPAPGLVVVVSLGGDGALFLTREQAVLAQPLPVAVTSTVGAGDAMVAGLVAAQLENLSLADTARLATAFAAAKLTRLGPHLPRPAEVRALAGQVVVSAID